MLGLVVRTTRDVVGAPLAIWEWITALPALRDELAHLNAPDGPIGQLADVSEALGRLALLDQSLRELATLDASLSLLPETLGNVEGHVRLIDGRLSGLQPSIEALSVSVVELHRAVDELSVSVKPLGRIAGRLPGGRRAMDPPALTLTEPEPGDQTVPDGRA